MNGDEEDTRVNLENSLSGLYQLLDRIEKAQDNYHQVLMRYLKPEKELKKPFGKKRIKIGILACVLNFVVFYALYSISNNDLIVAFVGLFFVFVGLITGMILVALFVKFRKDQEFLPRSLNVFILCDAAVLILGAVAQLTGIDRGGSLLSIGLLLLVYVPFRLHDARLPYINRRIEQRNQDARDAAYRAAYSELVPIEQEISAVRWLYREGNYSLWFPEKYLDTTSVAGIWNIIHDYRASNIQEAINQYVQDLHNQFMRDTAQQQVVEQQRNTRAAQIASVMNIGMQAFQGAATRATINTFR